MIKFFQPKNKIMESIVSTIMILAGTTFLSVMAKLPHLLIISSLGLIFSFFMKKKLEYSDRTITYGILACLVASVISDMIFPLDKENAFLLGPFISSNITAPLIIFLATISMFYKYNQYVLGFRISFCIGLIMIASDMTYNSSFSGSSVFNNYLFTSSVLIVFFCMLAILQIDKFIASPSIKINFKLKRKKILCIALALIFSIFSALIASETFRKYERHIKVFDSLLLKISSFRFKFGKSKYLLFKRDVRLDRTIGDNFNQYKDEIILRAISKKAPGYLRGRVYDNYCNGVWSANEYQKDKLKLIKNEEILIFNTFTLDEENDSKKSKIDILPVKKFINDILFLPGNTQSVDISATSLSVNPSGTVYPEEWDMKTGYTVYMPENQPFSAYQKPFDPDSSLLFVQSEITKELDEFIATIINDRKSNKFENDTQLVKSIESYLLSHFSYEILENPAEKGKDPILSFLKRQTGHCELFASATVMLLRRCGIPARYVTGFICEESNPLGQYYISRLGNAHAWAEAYLRDEKKWILVESTPPSGINNQPFAMNQLSQIFDSIKTILLKVLDDIRKGFFAKAIIDFFISSFDIIAFIVWHPIRGPFLLFVLIIIYSVHKFKKIHRNYNPFKIKPELIEAYHKYRKIEYIITAKSRIPRQKHETIQEWIKKLKKNGFIINNLFLEYLAKYEKIRYSNETQESDLNDFLKF